MMERKLTHHKSKTIYTVNTSFCPMTKILSRRILSPSEWQPRCTVTTTQKCCGHGLMVTKRGSPGLISILYTLFSLFTFLCFLLHYYKIEYESHRLLSSNLKNIARRKNETKISVFLCTGNNRMVLQKLEEKDAGTRSTAAKRNII